MNVGRQNVNHEVATREYSSFGYAGSSSDSEERPSIAFDDLPQYLKEEIESLELLSRQLLFSRPTGSPFWPELEQGQGVHNENSAIEQDTGSTPTGNDGNIQLADVLPILSLTEIAALGNKPAQFTHLLLRRHCLTLSLVEIGGFVLESILERACTYEALGYSELAMGDGVAVLEGVEMVVDGERGDLEPLRQDGSPWINEDVNDEDTDTDEDEDKDSTQDNNNAHGERVRVNGLSRDSSRTKDIRDAIEMKYSCLLLLYRCAMALGCRAQADLWLNMAVETCKIVVWHGMNDTVVRKKILEDNNAVWYLFPQSLPTTKDHDDAKARGHYGMSQRLIYPWNVQEPERMSDKSLAEINQKLAQAAPLLEARKSFLPALNIHNIVGTGEEAGWTQLGLYAKSDLEPGKIILTERSALTGIRPHDEALCDACAADLQDIPSSERHCCPGCDVPFCSEECLTTAKQKYHRPNEDDAETEEGFPPAETPFCPGTTGNTDIQTLGRAESSTTEEWDLYFLLLCRTLQMAETQDVHPLELFETKYLWGDFNHTPSVNHLAEQPGPATLPYSLKHHVDLPLQWFEFLMLSRSECAPYSAKWLERYDWWIIQTLYAKYRGVADAKQSTWTGKPEIAAVHPLWCIANHSCNPTVTWKPAGVRNLTVMEKKIWNNSGESFTGIKKDEQVWSHYTDVNTDYKERRDRLMEVLGGKCRCERCIYEAEQDDGSSG